MSPPSASDTAGPLAGVLDRRLSRHDRAPLLIAVSGGGDSLALLLAAVAWAESAGRALVAATVDHRLRPESADWALGCAARCRTLGIAHQTLPWEGAKPRTGLPAAARLARHRLLAEAARSAGARVILMGHTADDILEADWMRVQGARTPAPREWAPSPVWPEGRDIFVLRPLLGMRRSALRGDLTARGEVWIDDPANDDPASLRARARRALAGTGLKVDTSASEVAPPAATFVEGPAGELLAYVSELLAAGEAQARQGLAAALVCAGGGARTPRGYSLDLMLSRLKAGRPFSASLAGTRLGFDGARIVLAREANDKRRGPASDLALKAGSPTIWDGRFEFIGGPPGWSVGFVAGRAAHLSRADAEALRRAPPNARGAAPLLVAPDGSVHFPLARAVRGVTSRCLVAGRLAASSGAIQHESAIATWRNACARPKSLKEVSGEAVNEPS